MFTVGFALCMGGFTYIAYKANKEVPFFAFAPSWIGALVLVIAFGATQSNSKRYERALKLVKAGFINPIPTDGGDFNVSVSGIPNRVKLKVHDGKFYIVDLSGTERKVTSPADVREIVGK